MNKTRKIILLIGLALVLVFLLGGCKKINNSISIVNLSKHVEVIAKRTRRVTITGDLVRKRGTVEKIKIKEIKVDWGDGISITASSPGGFSSIFETHNYYSAGTYPITVTAKDKLGRKTKKTIVVIIDSVNPESPEEMVYVPAGIHKYTREGKPRTIAVYYDYYIGKYEVTNGEFVKFLNDVEVSPGGEYKNRELIDMDDKDVLIEYNKGKFKVKEGKEKYPVGEVTWYGAVGYCNWLSEQEGLPKAYDLRSGELKMKYLSRIEGYRLPTENEWEYAARGGREGKDTIYAGSDTIDEVAWYRVHNSQAYPLNPVGQKKPNELGLYDMSGNSWEWSYHSHFLNHRKSYALRSGYLEFDPKATSGPSGSEKNYGFRVVKTAIHREN